MSNIQKHNSKSSLKSKTVSSEINVIGENVEDAIFVIDKYIDDCYLSNLQTARIVHGKGTGKLRQGIHTYLKTNSHVKSFRLGTFGEGEMGVTVVQESNMELGGHCGGAFRHVLISLRS